jgi:hypothetical protein
MPWERLGVSLRSLCLSYGSKTGIEQRLHDRHSR